MSSFFSFLKVYIYSVKKKSFNYHQFTTAINCNFANIFRIWWFLFHKRCQTKDARIFFDFDFKPANLEHDARYQILNCKSSLKNFSKFCKCLKKMERLKEIFFFLGMSRLLTDLCPETHFSSTREAPTVGTEPAVGTKARKR